MELSLGCSVPPTPPHRFVLPVRVVWVVHSFFILQDIGPFTPEVRLPLDKVVQPPHTLEVEQLPEAHYVLQLLGLKKPFTGEFGGQLDGPEVEGGACVGPLARHHLNSRQLAVHVLVVAGVLDYAALLVGGINHQMTSL